ncbi:MAG: hypothetical protein PHI66_04655 [Candidatus Pacebacteria bacterium]|nr:hypothetical protein [Candidatus Paceibacterota bacterium]
MMNLLEAEQKMKEKSKDLGVRSMQILPGHVTFRIGTKKYQYEFKNGKWFSNEADKNSNAFFEELKKAGIIDENGTVDTGGLIIF